MVSVLKRNYRLESNGYNASYSIERSITGHNLLHFHLIIAIAYELDSLPCTLYHQLNIAVIPISSVSLKQHAHMLWQQGKHSGHCAASIVAQTTFHPEFALTPV